MSIFSSKPKPRKRKKNRGGNPTLYSPENQLAHKDATISPLDSHRLYQRSVPNPLTASGNRECHFQNILLCLEAGSHQLWYTDPAPKVESHWAGPGSVTPKKTRDFASCCCWISFRPGTLCSSNVTWLRWLRGTVKRSQMPANGLSPAQEENIPGFENQEVMFEGHSKRSKKICWQKMISISWSQKL